MGAVATVVDVAVLLVCVKALKMPNPVGAMVGVMVGSTLTFFANRHFAFRDHNPKLAPQALRFMAATLVSMGVHAGFVWALADKLNVPVVLAKLAADVCVFSVGQLFVLRYLVFPRSARHVAGNGVTARRPAPEAEPTLRRPSLSELARPAAQRSARER